MASQLIQFTDRGLYCSAGNFYIDPWKPVDKAVITHAHSDHARPGSKAYLCHHFTKPLLELRLGDYPIESLEWNEPVWLDGVKVSLHPAGHIIGSSQVRVEYKGEVWVVSGDYKTEDDGISGQFEPVQCDTFITESTFGLPIYKWKPQAEIFSNIGNWIRENHEAGKTSILMAYSLGKAQRLLPCIEATGLPIFLHGAVYNVHQTLVNAGWKLPFAERVAQDTPKELYKGNVVIAPGSADGTPWIKKFSPFNVGVCSGWMQVRGNRRRRNADAGFALSDHADWDGLLQAIKATGAQKVFVTHGFQSAFSRYLNELGIESAEVKTEYGTEDEETSEIKQADGPEGIEAEAPESEGEQINNGENNL
ncbi:MAG: ligase-associated DNA damage response exonuclease [Chitinophagaceae bacterium]|nr:MAG: ligase-associated DNA damage response exonuclease [Chitinophagaceae bacterium]